MGAGFPIDLVLFGMIAAFLVLRLRSILGRRDGYEPSQGPAQHSARPAGPVIEGKAEAPTATGRPLPDQASAVGQTLVRIAGVDAAFDPGRFLVGAEAAFRLIVTEFAAGNREALRPLLTQQTLTVFEGVIAAREAAGETQTSEIRSVQEAVIEEAVLNETMAEITVRFVSDQISQTLGRDGKVVAGADAVTELRDIWSFLRDLSVRNDPAWRLAQARLA